MKENSEDPTDIWHLRKECQEASKALRSRKISYDNNKLPSNSLSARVEEKESPTEVTVEKSPRQRRPGLMHRNTDPCPMREFIQNKWNEQDTNAGQRNLSENIEEKNQETISEDIGNYMNCLKKNIHNEEPFFISSYDLAKRRLSLPVSTLSAVEQTWRVSNIIFDDSDDTDNVSLETPVKNTYLPSCVKQLNNSPTMEKKRRQSAWVRAHSLNEEVHKPMNKRRMSELPALSALATRRKTVPHTLSLPIGLRRRASKIGNPSGHQNLNSSCLKAKNEMLATLSMSSWSENVTSKHSEISRRKSSYAGFGIVALKKKEEKRLMVAHEILQTEKNYIKALETLNEVFTEPLKNSCVIPEKDLKTMFPKQLLAMKNGHEKFMKELEDRLNNWKWQGVLGDIFTKLGNSYHVDFMTLYSEYVNNFPKSIAVINKYTRNSHKFKRFLEKCSNDKRCERLNISAFLLTPIQRLPRYVLLLRQLAKYTEPNHPDSFHIEISLEKMIDIINILNSSIQNSTRVARSTSARRSSRRSRKRRIFKPKESGNSNLTSPRKSSEDSECSETSCSSTPHAQEVSQLTTDITSPIPDQKSSDYGSMTPSETPPEARSPSPFSSSSSRGSFLRVILRNSGESKRSKRPLSTTEVEIVRRQDSSLSPVKDELVRSVSRDGIGSMIRSKFGSLRRGARSGENLEKNLSLERLGDTRTTLFKSRRATSPEEDSFNEMNECSKSDRLNSGSSMESCTGSHEHLPLSCEPSSLSHDQCHSDSDDSALNQDTHHDGDVVDNNDNKVVLRRRKDGTTNATLNRKKLGKRNSFTNAVKYFFVSKPRSHSSSPETVLDNEDQLYNSQFSKEQISALTTV